MAFYIKQNDSSPSLRVALKDGDGTAIDLLGASVKFYLVPVGETTPIVNATASILANGIVQYDWDNGDTSTPGTYKGEFEVTYAGGDVETFPNSDYISVIIKPELN